MLLWHWLAGTRWDPPLALLEFHGTEHIGIFQRNICFDLPNIPSKSRVYYWAFTHSLLNCYLSLPFLVPLNLFLISRLLSKRPNQTRYVFSRQKGWVRKTLQNIFGHNKLFYYDAKYFFSFSSRVFLLVGIKYCIKGL